MIVDTHTQTENQHKTCEGSRKFRPTSTNASSRSFFSAPQKKNVQSSVAHGFDTLSHPQNANFWSALNFLA